MKLHKGEFEFPQQQIAATLRQVLRQNLCVMIAYQPRSQMRKMLLTYTVSSS